MPRTSVRPTIAGRVPVKLNMISLFISLAVFLAAGIFLLSRTSGIEWTPWRVAGVAILAPALLLFLMARIQLGRAFSVKAKASTLVTVGLYSRIRNPIYVFGSLVLVGIILIAGKPWLLLLFVVIVPMQVYRSRKESHVLEEKFGDEYREYKKKTWI